MKKIFVFPGQGSQTVGMGKTVYNRYDTAKNIFGKVNDILNRNLSNIMFEGPLEELNLTKNTQPALMALSIALLETILHFKKTKIKDECLYVAGHSLGEYSALCASGSISLENTTKLLEKRGIVMQKACEDNPGSMAACINIAEDDLNNIVHNLSLKGILNIANYNSENQTVISGQSHLVDQAIEQIRDRGGKSIKLKVNGGFHSALMQEAENLIATEIDQMQIKSPSIPIIMNTSASPASDEQVIKTNLKKQITSSVKWRQIIDFSLRHELEIVEIGAGNTLSNLARKGNYPFSIVKINDAQDLEDFLNI